MFDATSKETPRVWIGCLGCYNAGTLTGLWFDAIDCPQDMTEFNEAIDFDPTALTEDGERMTSKRVVVSKDHGHPIYGPHDELWCMDFENFEGFLDGECSPMEAKRIAEVIEAIEDDGFDIAAVAAWMSHTGEKVTEWDASTLDDFQSAFAGEYASMSDFATEYLEGSGFWQDVPERIQNYQDAIEEAWLSSTVNGGEVYTEDTARGYYVFWNWN